MPFRDEPGFPENDLIRAFIEGLELQEDHRWQIIDMLGEFGPSAEEAVPVLEKLLHTEQYHVRSCAVIALKKIKYPTPE